MLNRLSLLLLLCLSATLAHAATPTITSFAPVRGVVGTVITINGTDLNGATAVAFNGVPVKAFGTNSANTLFALVPEGATTGKITVTNAKGTAISVTDFAVLFFINNPIDGAKMVWVPGGTFTMGSADGMGLDNEHPAHQVTLTDYWVYQYDVTVAQYRTFCTTTTRELPKFPSDYSWKGKTGWDDPALQQHPIVNITWNDAKAYADWAGVVLPTEAQWEYAARGPQGRNYPWGGTATKDDKCNGWDATKCVYWDNSGKVSKSTWPVGSFPAGDSWCGAQDMAGNVWQWCGDWSGAYTAAEVTNPTGPATGKYRVLRGGSWYYSGDDYYFDRSAIRHFGFGPDGYGYGIGFRCASIAPGP